MKLKTLLMGSIAVATMGLAVTANAASNYYPPERITCSTTSSMLHCEGINHKYLVEDMVTADFSGKATVFSFTSGVTYFSLDKSQATVMFTYKDAHNKAVRLRTVSPSIRPDMRAGDWQKIQDDLYVCKGGYMRCPVTSLPARA